MIDLEKLIADAVARELDRRGITAKPANDAEAITVAAYAYFPTVAIPWNRPGRGFVYFLQCDAFPYPIKIGSALDIPQRLRAIRAGNPFDVRLVAWSLHDEPQFEEKRLHARFARSKLRSEWFVPTTGLAALINELRLAVESST